MSSASHDINSEPRCYTDREIKRLDHLSNAANSAIRAGRHEKAERFCEKIQKQYPEMIDGPHRLAELRSSQGRWKEAADACDQALGIIARDLEGFDRHGIDYFRGLRDQARKNAGLPPTRSLPPQIAAYLAPAPLRLVRFIVRKIREFRIR
jgi:tetratricopeptide (TPR) repeat protein